jgi:hypothetical protein
MRSSLVLLSPEDAEVADDAAEGWPRGKNIPMRSSLVLLSPEDAEVILLSPEDAEVVLLSPEDADDAAEG